MEPDDKQLVAQYGKGDEDALATLIRRHIKPVYNFIYRFTGNAHDAEDIVQEAFVKVWRNINKYRPDESFKTWLFAIAHNTAIDLLRKKKHLVFSDFENSEGENFLLETLADPEAPPDEVIATLEEKKMVEGLLSQLPLLYREVLVLRYQDDFTFKEIGAILHKPLDTVKSQHRRALIVLKKLIDAPK